MQAYEAIFRTIDMGSFSSIWYWFVVIAVWTAAGRWVMGVPYDVVMRARRDPLDAEAEETLFALARIAVARHLQAGRRSGVWLTAAAAFVLSVLAALAWAGLELAQALILIGGPLALVALLNLRLAHRLEREGPDAETLCKLLIWHRMAVQMIATLSIFVTAIWGMIHNLNLN